MYAERERTNKRSKKAPINLWVTNLENLRIFLQCSLEEDIDLDP